MKARYVKIWTTALRSGEYKQIKGALHDGHGFCCLGVAVDELMDGDWNWNSENYSYGFDENTGLLSSDVLTELGLSDTAQVRLSNLNDDGFTFEEIADFIEKHVGHLDEPGYIFDED